MTTHDRPWSLKLFGPKVDIMRVKHNSVNSEDFSVSLLVGVLFDVID